MSDPMDALFDNQMVAGDNQLKNLAGLIEAEDAANSELETLETMAADVKAKRTELRNKLIPEAMLEAKTREFTTDGGLKAKLSFSTDGSLGSPKTAEEFAAKEAKLDLIIEHGGAEIVKQVVSIAFPKELARQAEGLRSWLGHVLYGDELTSHGKLFADWLAKPPEERGQWPVSITRERSVNHQTLMKFIKDKMEEDSPADRIPMTVLEKLGIWYGEIAKITRPKPKK